MSEKIVLIDGHSILNRAFYGLLISPMQRASYQRNLWVPYDHVQNIGRGKTGIPDSCL